MSEYWKSLPRKFCEACKCWFADNKASIDFHERGRRHQENVKRRLETLRKKGQREFKAKQKLNYEIQKIEREALKAFKKDVQSNPELQEGCDSKMKLALGAVNISRPTVSVHAPINFGIVERNKHVTKAAKSKKEIKECASTSSSSQLFEPTVLRTWYEAETPEGGTYYWNIETNETSWETPIAFVSLMEQREKEAKKRLELSHKYADQANPYGQWTRVESSKKEIDLQLPVPLEGNEEEEEQRIIEIPLEEEERKFKEKTLKSLSSDDSGPLVSFKKRKVVSNVKKNVRQRFDENE